MGSLLLVAIASTLLALWARSTATAIKPGPHVLRDVQDRGGERLQATRHIVVGLVALGLGAWLGWQVRGQPLLSPYSVWILLLWGGLSHLHHGRERLRRHRAEAQIAEAATLTLSEYPLAAGRTVTLKVERSLREPFELTQAEAVLVLWELVRTKNRWRSRHSGRAFHWRQRYRLTLAPEEVHILEGPDGEMLAAEWRVTLPAQAAPPRTLSIGLPQPTASLRWELVVIAYSREGDVLDSQFRIAFTHGPASETSQRG